MVKIAILFLAAIVALALASRWMRGRPPPPRIGRFCPHCGRPRRSAGPCDCGGE